MASQLILPPYSAEFPSSNFPQLQLVNRRPVLSFDGATNEACQWSFIVPQSWVETATAYIYYIMASDTSGDVDIDIDIEAISDGDATDLDAGNSFDTVNSTDGTTVPATAGYMDVVAVTLTNNDSLARGDYVRIRLTRDAASDTATGDMHVLMVEIRDGA